MLLLINLLLLKESPRDMGLSEPAVNPSNLFREGGEQHTPVSVRSLLATFGRSRVFWLVCVLSLGMTLVRETFNLVPAGEGWLLRSVITGASFSASAVS